MFKRLLAVMALMLSAALPLTAQAAFVGPLSYTLANGQPADAAQVMANFNKIVNDVNTNVIFPSFTQQSYYAAATGTANALIVAVSPTPTLYAPGMVINAKIATTNTGPATINVNGLGLQNIVNPSGAALKSQQMIAGMVAQLIYDGTQFQLTGLSPLGIRQAAVSRTTQLFTTPGAWTFTVPVGVYSVRLEAWGAGGGGGGGAGGFNASGAASGSYGQTYLTVSPGDIISGVLGTGGTGGLATPTSGTAGGNTTVLLNGVLQGTAPGGGPGLLTPGANQTSAGVAVNVSGSWSISFTGQNGGPGFAGSFGGLGGSAPRGGVGGYSSAAGCSNGGNPGGGASGSGGAGCAGGNGWVFIEY